jgi:UrcA family protein
MNRQSGLVVGMTAMLALAAVGHMKTVHANVLNETEISSTVITSGTEVHHAVVSYGDLNLKNSADVAELYRRIDAAAGSACGSRYFLGSHAVSRFWTMCKTRAVNDAIASLKSRQLADYARKQQVLAQATSGKPQARS